MTARRLEVITETGRRRWFSKDDQGPDCRGDAGPRRGRFRDCPATRADPTTSVHLAPASAPAAGADGGRSDNLRTRKLQLEQRLTQGLSDADRERVEGELTEIEIALSFLDDIAKVPAGPPAR